MTEKNKGHFPTHENRCRVAYYCDASCWMACRFGVSKYPGAAMSTMTTIMMRECKYKNEGHCTSPEAIKEAIE